MDKNPLIGLAGVLVATMMTDFASGVTTAALPDIRGGLGISADPGTWLQSLYITGEAAGMALAPWWAVTLTLRRFTLGVIAFNCLTSMLIPATSNLTLLYGLQFLQGFAGGLTIPLLMTTALRVLDPPIRLYGLAAYALTATCFPNLSVTIAALWTSGVGWQFTFYEALPLSAIAAVLVWWGMPQDEPHYERLRKFDWRGAVLIIIGFGALTTMLMQGDRYDWFNSNTICVLALISAVSIPLLLINEWFHELPLLKLQLFSRRNFAYGGIALFIFLIISLSSSQIPMQYLQQVQGYRPLQAYSITLEIALAQLVLLPIMALVLNIKWIDARLLNLAGLACILVACIGASFITSAWNRNQFYLWQGLQAVGEPLVIMPLLMMSTNSVVPQEGPFASALINLPRALAEAASTWVLNLITRWRGDYHSEQLVNQVGLNRFRLIQGSGVSPHYPPPLLASGLPRSPGSLTSFAQSVQRQATVLALSDGFLVIACLVVLLAVILILLTQRTYPPRIVFANQ